MNLLFFSTVEAYDKKIITCHFSYRMYYQPQVQYQPSSHVLSALKPCRSWADIEPRADNACDMKNAM